MMSFAATEIRQDEQTVSYRHGTAADSFAVFTLFERTLHDLVRRMGIMRNTSIDDPQALAYLWEERRSLYSHLADTAAQYWVAERDGEIIGFSRSILRGTSQELTEFFVLPDDQSAGVGRELIRRALPEENAAHRTIIATLDTRAQARYLKAGVYPRFPLYYFSRRPVVRSSFSGLTVSPIKATPEALDLLGGIDAQILEHRRDVDHIWLLGDRQGYLYLRGDHPVGYGYLGHRNGPFALLDAADYLAVLAHAETEAAFRGDHHFGLEVPMINTSAVDYLLGAGFQIEQFMTVFMSNVPYGKFDSYIFTSPPFFM